MTTIDLSADEIFRRDLLHLGNETKRRLIELLASSLTFSDSRTASAEIMEKRKALLDKVNGAWSDDELTAEEEIKHLRDARVQGKTRKIADL
ncbi:hypothetical protein [Bacteroidaceae bacterium]